MDVFDIRDAVKDIQAVMDETKLMSAFDQLIGALEPPDGKRSVKQVSHARDVLTNSLLRFDQRVAPKGRRDAYIALNQVQHLGQAAADRVASIFNRNPANPELIANGIRRARDDLQARALVWSQLRELLGEIPVAPRPDLPAGKQVLELTFRAGSSMRTLEEMEEWAHTWKLIIAAYGRLMQVEPEHQIIRANAGSVVLEIAAISAAVGAIVTGAGYILKLLSKHLALKQQAADIRKTDAETQVELSNVRKNDAEAADIIAKTGLAQEAHERQMKRDDEAAQADNRKRNAEARQAEAAARLAELDVERAESELLRNAVHEVIGEKLEQRARELEADADEFRSSIPGRVANKLIEILPDDVPDRNEVRNAVEMAVKEELRFFEGGGTVRLLESVGDTTKSASATRLETDMTSYTQLLNSSQEPQRIEQK